MSADNSGAGALAQYTARNNPWTTASAEGPQAHLVDGVKFLDAAGQEKRAHVWEVHTADETAEIWTPPSWARGSGDALVRALRCHGVKLSAAEEKALIKKVKATSVSFEDVREEGMPPWWQFIKLAACQRRRSKF